MPTLAPCRLKLNRTAQWDTPGHDEDGSCVNLLSASMRQLAGGLSSPKALPKVRRAFVAALKLPRRRVIGIVTRTGTCAVKEFA